MKKLNFCIGLPRSGSTLLMNILQQNPIIFTTSTCPTPYFLESCKHQANNVSEFIAMDQDVLNKCFTSFIHYGLDGWFSSLTNKPLIISKSRSWDMNLNFILSTFTNPKILVCLRDIRDIICSYEKLLHRYPMWTIRSEESFLHLQSFDERIRSYCLDLNANLGRPLSLMPYIYENMQKHPNNFFIFRFEDFNNNPIISLKSIYNWLDLPYFEHDLNNISQSELYEHDTVYRALVSHKTETKLKKLKTNYLDMMTDDQSKTVITNNEFFYKTFYPEVYNNL